LLDPIILQFTTAGIPQVERAFATVEQQLQKMERNSSQVADRGARTRVKTAQGEARDRERAAAKIQKDAERLERQHTRDVEKETKRREAIVRKSSEMTGRLASQQAREEGRAEAEKTRNVARESERRMRLQIRAQEMAGRFAARQAAEDLRRQEGAASIWGQRGRRVGGIVTGSAGRTLSGMASLVGAGLGIGGGMMLADAARGEMSAHKSAQLIMNAVTTGGVVPQGASVDAILGKASQVARANGMSKEEVAQAGLAYSRSATGGDFAGVLGNMDFFAKVHNVTGADMSDLASSAGMLQSQNPQLGGANNGKMQQLLLDVIAQTHMGSLSMPEVAKMAGVIGSGRGAFGGDQGQNQRKLLALAQLVAPETNPDEAGIMVKDFATEGQKHFKKLEKFGVKYNARGQMDSIEQAIDAILTGSGGNQGKIIEALGSDRAAKLFSHLAPIYNDAGGGAAGLAKVHQAVTSVTAATTTPDQLNQANADTLNEPARKFEVALNNIKTTLEDKLSPGMGRLADKLPYLVDKVTGFIDSVSGAASWMTDSWPHTFIGIGGIVMAVIAKDLASAGISAAAEAGVAAIMKKIAASMGAGSAPIPTPGGAPPIPGGGAGPGLVGGALAGAGFVSFASNIVTGDKDILNHQITDDPKQDPSKLAFWQSLPDDAKKKFEEAKKDPWHFFTTDPNKEPSPNAAGRSGPKEATGDVVAFSNAVQDATKKLALLSTQATNTAPGNPALHVPIGTASR
jgi:hypothetical protein